LSLALIGFDASPFGPAPLGIGLSLLLVGLPLLLMSQPIPHEWGRDPIVWLTGILTVWTLLRAAGDFLVPVDATLAFDPEGIWYQFRASGFLSLLIGIWIARNHRFAWAGVALMIVGMMVFPYFKIAPNDLIDSLTTWKRLDHGPSPNELGLIASITLLVGIVLATTGLRYWADGKNRLIAAVLLASGAYLLLTNLAFLFGAKSRAAWVATALLVPLAGVYAFRVLAARLPRPMVWSIYGALGVMLFTIIGNQWDLIADRIGRSGDTITALLQFNPAAIEFHSMGKRWLMWEFAIERTWAHPLWGWGPGFVAGTLDEISTNHLKDIPSQYHNTYLHISVSMGLIWAALWIALHAVLVWRGAASLARSTHPQPLVTTGLAFLLPILITGLADYRLNNADGAGLYLFGTGLLIGVLIKQTPQAVETGGEERRARERGE
jgi:O-antigen ligase